MKIIYIVLFLPCISLAQMTLPIVDVYDGDTIKTYMPFPDPLHKVSIRVLGIDTPENPAKSYLVTGKLGRAKCVKEADLALKAKQVVVDLAKGSNTMLVDSYKYGKYGGRIVGDVTINGINVADHLIKLGLAVPYFGKAKTMDWCK